MKKDSLCVNIFLTLLGGPKMKISKPEVEHVALLARLKFQRSWRRSVLQPS